VPLETRIVVTFERRSFVPLCVLRVLCGFSSLCDAPIFEPQRTQRSQRNQTHRDCCARRSESGCTACSIRRSNGNWHPQQRVSRRKSTGRACQIKVVAPLLDGPTVVGILNREFRAEKLSVEPANSKWSHHCCTVQQYLATSTESFAAKKHPPCLPSPNARATTKL
jgi:hypothetical protein